METSDSRQSAFDADKFRDAILFAMKMGVPEAVEQRVTFRWRDVKTFTASDPGGSPYSWTSTPLTESSTDDVQVTCAVEFSSRTSTSGQTAFNNMNTSRAEITLLDTEYQQVKTADVILIGENEYKPDFVAPPVSLFTETVWTIFASAVDES